MPRAIVVASLAVATCMSAAVPHALAGGPLGGGPAGGLYYYLGTSTLPSGGVANRTTVCSEPGSRVIGGGFDTDTGSQTGVLLRSQPFNADSDDKPDDGWWTWAQSRRFGDGTLASYAICSFDNGIKYRSRQIRLESDETETLRTPCPDETRVTSGGVETPNDDQVEVSGTYPVDDNDAGAKPDDGWAAKMWNFESNRAFVTVHAVCVAGARMQYTTSDFGIGADTTFELFSFPCSDDAYMTGAGARPLSPLTIEGSGITAAIPADLEAGESDTVPDDRAIFQTRNDDAAGDIRYLTACIRRG